MRPTHVGSLVDRATEQLVSEVRLAAFGGWKPESEEEERRIARAVARSAARRSWRYRLRFWAWRRRLDFWAAVYGCRYRYSKSTGAECWLQPFEDGSGPKDALLEDWSYA